MPNMKIFGDYLKENRLANAMTIRQLAEETGMCEANIWKCENGKYPNSISLEHALALGRALGCKIDEIAKIHTKAMNAEGEE